MAFTRVLSAVAIVVLGTAAALAAPTQAQIDAVQYVAEATVIAKVCPTLSFNKPAAGSYLSLLGIDDILADANLEAAFNAKYQSATYAAEGNGEERTCLAGEVFYGADGSNAPGLLVKAP